MKKMISRTNGGIAIYYGFGCIVGAIAGVIGTVVWLFRVFNNQAEFTWGTLAGLTIITVVLGILGYSITRVGYEEIDK